MEIIAPIASKRHALLDEIPFVDAPSRFPELELRDLATPPPSTDDFAVMAGLPEARNLAPLQFDITPLPAQSVLDEVWSGANYFSGEFGLKFEHEVPSLCMSVSLSDDEDVSGTFPVGGYAEVVAASVNKRRAGTASAAEDSDSDSEFVAAAPKRRKVSPTTPMKAAKSKAPVANSNPTAPSRPTGFAKTRGVKVVPIPTNRPGRSPVAVSAGTSATLPRDALLNVTSADLNEFAKLLEQVRELTTEDRRELQRQRRLVKNRESAQLSRLRKKASIETLESAIAKEKGAMEATRVELARLASEIAQVQAML